MPKISQFPAGGAAQNTDLIPVVRNGGDYTVTAYNFAALASYGQAFVGTFTATAGQTVFTLPASPGSSANLTISVDGSTMVPGTDYNWTAPTTLTFLTGLSVGQTVLYRYTTSVPVGTSLAGGVNGQIQYNNSGTLNGSTLSYSSANFSLTIPAATGAATLTVGTSPSSLNVINGAAGVNSGFVLYGNADTNGFQIYQASNYSCQLNSVGAAPMVFSTNSTNRLSLGSTGVVTVAPSTAVPTGGSTAVGINASSTANLGVFFGSGAPTMSAAQGSLYLRTDGSSTSTRAYINTNGTTGWTNIVTAT